MGSGNSTAKGTKIKYPERIKYFMKFMNKGVPSSQHYTAACCSVTVASYYLVLAKKADSEEKEQLLAEATRIASRVQLDYLWRYVILAEIAFENKNEKEALQYYSLYKEKIKNCYLPVADNASGPSDAFQSPMQFFYYDTENNDCEFFGQSLYEYSQRLGKKKYAVLSNRAIFANAFAKSLLLKENLSDIEINQFIDDFYIFGTLNNSNENLEEINKSYFIYHDLTKIHNLLVKLAEKGIGKAQYVLALTYLEGINLNWGSIPQDENKAIHWFTQSGQKKYWHAYVELGFMYLQGGKSFAIDLNKAFEFFLQGAKLSQQLSQAEIEELSGLPVIKQEIVLTHAFVGDRYRKGLGVQKNIEQALYWLNSAAKQYDKNDKNFYEFIRKGKSILNSNDIWLNLAEIYRDGGAGVEKNPVQAIYYFNKLATIFTTYKMPERAEVYKNEAETLKLQLAIANNQTVILQNTSSPAYAHPAIASSSLMIDYGSLTIKQPALGAGAFGEVYYAECGYEKYAVKQLRMQNLDENALNDLKKEAQIMANLDSEFIIRLRGICIKPYCIVMEFAPKGTLYKYLHSDETIPWERCLKIAIGIGKGLSYLYSQNPQILHRDLKSANVLLNDNYQALLSDFGLSKLKSESSSKVTMGAAGTPAWMAPELFGDKPHHTVEADIYSYAIVLWELATRKDPYEGLSMMQIMGKLYHNERPDFPENACSEAYRKTVTNAWRKEPSERSSLKTIIDDLSQQLGNKDKASETGNQSIGNLGAPSTDLPAQSTGFLGAPSMVK